MESCLELTSIPESFSHCKSHQCISLCKSDAALWVTAGPALAPKATRSTRLHEMEGVATRLLPSLPLFYLFFTSASVEKWILPVLSKVHVWVGLYPTSNLK